MRVSVGRSKRDPVTGTREVGLDQAACRPRRYIEKHGFDAHVVK